METKKIAIGCFVGGVLCTAVALICTPMFWWLGLLAGLAGGYLGYEFREVLRAIPIAWRKSRKGIIIWWSEADEKVRKLSFGKLEFPTVFFIIIAFLFFSGITTAISWFIVPTPDWGFRLFCMIGSFATVFALFVIAVYSAILVWILLFAIALLGARVGEKCFWFPFLDVKEEQQESEAEKLEKKGYRKKKLTGKNFSRWFMEGIVLCILLGLKYFFVGIWLSLCFLRRFLWNLFKLIHSKKRVLCAIDGTVGGAIAFFCFASTSLTLPQQILVVFFGGLLGAVIGVLNYEIISKRVLHLAWVVNNT